jgi:V8-like Glu-specific endopeptidase
VLILGSYGTVCTATTIAPDLLLTAAHRVQPGAQYKLADVSTAAGNKKPAFEHGAPEHCSSQTNSPFTDRSIKKRWRLYNSLCC